MEKITAENFLDFGVSPMIQELLRCGAFSTPFISETTRQLLAAEANKLHFVPRQSATATGVQQDLSACDTFPPESIFLALRDGIQQFMERKLRELPQYPFETPLEWNDLSLQKYEPESQGISPHRDYKRLRNLIGILVLKGSCRFCVCRDRAGNGIEEIDAAPGNIIFIRAEGFLGNSERPFHFIDHIKNLRITLGLRQETIKRVYI